MGHIINKMIYTIYIYITWVSLKIGHQIPSTILSSLSLFGMAILGVYPVFRHIQTCFFYSYMGLTGNMGSPNPLIHLFLGYFLAIPLIFQYWNQINKTCNHWKQPLNVECHVSSLLMALLPQHFCLCGSRKINYWDPISSDLMVFNGDLMVFNGDLMVI